MLDRKIMPDLDPLQRESVAAWIEYLGKPLPELDPLAQEALATWIEYEGQKLMKPLGLTESLRETHPEYPHLSRQAVYYRCANSFAIYLAYRVRTAKTKKLVSPLIQAR